MTDTPLLTADQEHELAAAIEAGLLAEALDPDEADGWAVGIDPRDRPSPAERAVLVAAGREAWTRFVRANLGLVRVFSVRAAQQAQLAEADLFQEGCVALMIAVQRFDHRRGVRFSTYAVPWIRAAVSLAAAHRCGELDLPAHRAGDLRRVRATESAMTALLGRTPTTLEIARELAQDAGWVGRIRAHQPTRSIEEAPWAQVTELEPSDAEAGAGLDRVLDQLVVAGPGPGLLSTLPDLQRQVVSLRCGFVGGRPFSRREVAARLGVGRRRVRTLEENALAALRRRLADRAA